MPLPFGLEIHWPRDATEWAAWTGLALVVVTAIYVLLTRASVEELRKGTAKTVKELRESTEKTVAELREARFAEFLPMLRWQSPKAAVGVYDDGNKTWESELDVLLSNEGPGPARLYDYSVTTDTREQFDVVGGGPAINYSQGRDVRRPHYLQDSKRSARDIPSGPSRFHGEGRVRRSLRRVRV
jgi:hypothetical protein